MGIEERVCLILIIQIQMMSRYPSPSPKQMSASEDPNENGSNYKSPPAGTLKERLNSTAWKIRSDAWDELLCLIKKATQDDEIAPYV